MIILEDSSWQVRSYTHRILVGLLGLVGLHGPCQEKHVLRALNSRSNDQLTNFQESFWTNGDFETADYVCAAEMFGPPLVMPMAHRNKLQQGTMRGLGQGVPPHTGKILRGCYMMNFSLHPEIVQRFWPKAMCWCTFAGQPCSHIYGIYGQMPRQRWGLALRSEESLLPVIAQRKAIIAFHFETNFISGKNRSTRPDMHR